MIPRGSITLTVRPPRLVVAAGGLVLALVGSGVLAAVGLVLVGLGVGLSARESERRRV